MYKIFSFSPVEKCFIFWREKQSAISDTYGNNTRTRVTHRFEFRCTYIQYVHSVYHPECTKRLIIGIILPVTEPYEPHRLPEDLRSQNGSVKITAFVSICILPTLPSVIIDNTDLLKHGWLRYIWGKFNKIVLHSDVVRGDILRKTYIICFTLVLVDISVSLKRKTENQLKLYSYNIIFKNIF